MLVFWSESRSNTVKKEEGSVRLHKQQFDSLAVDSRAPRLSNVAIRPKF